MEPLDAAALPAGALLLVDSAPIIYTLEGNARFARRFAPLFERHALGELSLAVTTVTIAEVLCGPLSAGEEALAKRYRATLETWQVVDLDTDIAESAAHLRATYHLKLPDAIQLASALAINADALVTHDRDFAKVRGLRILGCSGRAFCAGRLARCPCFCASVQQHFAAGQRDDFPRARPGAWRNRVVDARATPAPSPR